MNEAQDTILPQRYQMAVGAQVGAKQPPQMAQDDEGGAGMSVELKPCPFCGNHADLDFHANGCKQYFDDMGVSYNTPTLYTVKCRWCGCLIGAYESTDGAIEAWNRRAET